MKMTLTSTKPITHLDLIERCKKGNQKAIEFYQRSLRLDPTYSTTYFNLAYAHEAVKQWDAAIDAYQKAIQYLPDDPAAYYRLGKLYLKLNREEEASVVFEHFLEIAPEGPYKEEVKDLLKRIQKK